jgi:hypothetical protein
MTVGQLSSRTPHSDAVTERVALVRGRLAEIIGRVTDRQIAHGAGHFGPGGRVHRGPLGLPNGHGASVDDRQ